MVCADGNGVLIPSARRSPGRGRGRAGRDRLRGVADDDDVEALLRRAVPRLRKDDDGAQKIRRKLVKMALDAWAEGPRRLRALGVTVDKGSHALLDDASAEGLHEALGDAGFVTLFKALKDELTDKLSGKKPDAPAPAPRASSSSSGRVARASSGRAKRATASSAGRVEKRSKTSGRARRASPSGSDRLTMSSREEDASGSATGSGELAIPDELALPPDEPMLGVPDDEPMSIRFDDDAPAAAMTKGAPAKAAKGDDDDDDDPSRAGDRAVARYRTSGDPDDLDDAKKLYTRAAKTADGDLARGAARAGLAQVALLAGDAARAKEHAEKALALFPDEPTALRVLLRAQRQGEPERERIQGALLRARAALRSKDWDGALKVAPELEAIAPREPFGPMVALAVQHEKGDKKGLEAAIARVWERYPASVTCADLPLGPELERPVVIAPLTWVRQRIEQEREVLGQTVTNVDSKQNVISGAVQLAMGVSRVALATRGKLSPIDEQELRKWAGQSLLAAQYYDHAKEVLAHARTLDRNSGHVLEINKDETNCGVMKRAFDKPGVKAKSGKLDGVGLVQHRKALAARLQMVLAQKDEALGTYEQDEERLVAAVAASPERRKKLEARARKAGQESPFARLDAVEAELSKLDARAADVPADAPAAGGLFGRMKGGFSKALDNVKSAAKGAELALRKGVAASKQKEAARALAMRLRDRPDGGWGDAELDPLLDRWREVSSRVEALDEEAEELRRAAGKAGQV